MKDAPAFDFYPERFWFAVEGWTDQEILRYWRLLGQQWMRDGLPEAIKELEGLARGKLTQRVLSKFPVSADGKRRNRFLETLREGQRKRRADRARGAAETNKKRYANRSQESHSATASSDENPTTTVVVRESTTSGVDSPPDHIALVQSVENQQNNGRTATILRASSASPPPTTHHPPQGFKNGDDPCTLAEAIEHGRKTIVPGTNINWADRASEHWWKTRLVGYWMRGDNNKPITPQNWREDMEISFQWAHNGSDPPRCARGKKGQEFTTPKDKVKAAFSS